MIPSRLPLAVTALAITLLFALTVPTTAANKTPKPAAPPPVVDKRVLIKSVDVKAGTVEIEPMRGKPTHTYKIDGATSITVNGSPGTIDKITAGMQVRDSVERDNDTLDSISVGDADPSPVMPKKK